MDFVVRPQSKIDPDEIRARAKQAIQDQRRMKVGFFVATGKYKHKLKNKIKYVVATRHLSGRHFFRLVRSTI